jgi:hypothetical protein
MRGPFSMPGSLAARDAGCTCAIYQPRGRSIVEGEITCPLHGRHATDNGESDQQRGAQPARLSGRAT